MKDGLVPILLNNQSKLKFEKLYRNFHKVF